MPKKCKKESCSNHVFGGGYCHFHQYLRLDKELKPKKRNIIKKVSEKMRILTNKYIKLRTFFLTEHPICEAQTQNCTKVAVDVHHKQGRVGRLNCPVIM